MLRLFFGEVEILGLEGDDDAQGGLRGPARDRATGCSSSTS